MIVLLRHLELYRIASAVMWVLKEMLKMDEKFLLVQANEKSGKILLDEMMQAGNLGHFDNRVKNVCGNPSFAATISGRESYVAENE